MTKYPIFILISAFLLLSISSCRKDSVIIDDPVIQNPEIFTTIQSKVSGLVTLPDGKPAKGVIVSIGSNTFLTNDFGYFKFGAEALNKNGQAVKFELDGYFNTYRTIYPNVGNAQYLEVELIEKFKLGTITASEQNFNFPGSGANVDFTNSRFVDENNVAYTGNVQLYGHYYNPDDENFSNEMPAGMQGINLENESGVLLTYGMMVVELFAENGQKLNLADNSTAQLKFPIPTSATNAPNQVPVWSLDEQSGIWKEEELAIAENNFYVVNVSHFSFWNCDDFFDAVNFEGTAIDQNGNPISGLSITLEIQSSGLTSSGSSDQDGHFSGLIPINEILILKVYSECGLMHEEEIGPFTANVDIGQLTINTEVIANINGFLNDCETPANPIQNGLVIVKDGDEIIGVLESDPSLGIFNGSVDICMDRSLTVIGLDFDSGYSDTVIIDGVVGEQHNVGNLMACNVLETYFDIDYADRPDTVIINHKLERVGMIHQIFTDEFNVDPLISIENMVLGQNIPQSVTFKQNGVNYFCAPCDGKVTLNVDQLPTSLGEYLEGTAEGEVVDSNGIALNFVASFKVPLREEFEVVSGRAWVDDNENGLLDYDDPVLISLEVQVIVGPTKYSVLTGSFGEYTLKAPVGSQPTIQILPGLSVPTEPNVGSDDSIDSDFELDGTVTGITIEANGGPYVFDVGLIPFNNSISGTVLADTDLDGIGDTPAENILISINDVFGNFIAAKRTDVDGNYLYEYLRDENYRITIYDTSLNAMPAFIDLMVEGNNAYTGNDFVIQTLGRILGTSLLDTNNDGIGDTPMEGVTIQLLDEFGSIIENRFTNALGAYQFTGLQPGEYSVREVDPTGTESVRDEDTSPDNDTFDNTDMNDNIIPVTIIGIEFDDGNNFINK